MSACRNARRRNSAPDWADCARVWNRVPSAHHQIADDPYDECENDRAADGGARQPVDLTIAEAVAGIPEQMPDAAERVMDERPRITEQHDAPNEGAEEPLYVSV